MANIPISAFTVPANTVGIGLSGFSLTGSNAQSIVDLAGTWNTTGTPTALKLNVTDTASNAASLLMDLQVGGSSLFSVRKNGAIALPAGSTTAPMISVPAWGATYWLYASGDPGLAFWAGPNSRTEWILGSPGLALAGPGYIGWSAGSATGGKDLQIWRDAADTLAQRRSTIAQTFRIYNTFTDASNGEWFETTWSAQANTIVLRANNNGTGTLRNLHLRAFAMQVWSNSVYFTTETGVVSVAVVPRSSGVASLVDTSGSDFGRLQFGGTTSSYPALKRNSTALETKLADDSAYAPHAMQYLDVTDGITAPASATGRARIYVDTADGDLKVIFADGTVKTIVTDS